MIGWLREVWQLLVTGLKVEEAMDDYVETPQGGAVVAVAIVGLLAGVIASLLWLIIGVMIFNKSALWLFPIYLSVGTIGAVLVVVTLVAREIWSGNCDAKPQFSRSEGVVVEQDCVECVRVASCSDFNDPKRRASANRKIHREHGRQVELWAAPHKLMRSSSPQADLYANTEGDPESLSSAAEDLSGSRGRGASMSDIVAQLDFAPAKGGQKARRSNLSIDTLEERLFRRAVQLDCDIYEQSGRTVGYFGDHDSESFETISSWADYSGQTLIPMSPADVSWSATGSALDLVDLCFVDTDFMDDVEDAISFCVDFRDHAPNIQLILISSEVRGHDLTAERAAICDATIKSPLTERIIKAGVAAADNNFNQRLSVPRAPCRKTSTG